METLVKPTDPTILLIEAFVKELNNEVVYNKDSSKFWEKSMEYVFDMSLASFRESLSTFTNNMREDVDMINYFSSLSFRIFTQPFTRPALDLFVKSYEEVSADDVFKGAFSFRASELSKVEQLILFFSVHRNEITIAMYEREAQREAERIAARTRGKNK